MAKLVDAPSSGGGVRKEVRMVSVYVISSLVRNYLYVGMSENVDRRLGEHNAGKNRSAKAYRPFELVFREDFSDRVTARNREKYLKSGSGKEFLSCFRKFK